MAETKKEETKKKAEVVETQEEKFARLQAEAEEYVPIRLFRDNDKYKDDVIVGVNGESCQIKRGEDVMIKRKFYEVIKHSEEAQNIAYDYMNSLQKDSSI